MAAPNFGDKPLNLFDFLKLAGNQNLVADRNPEAKKGVHAYILRGEQGQIVGYGDSPDGKSYKFVAPPQQHPVDAPLPPAPASLYAPHATEPVTRPMPEKDFTAALERQQWHLSDNKRQALDTRNNVVGDVNMTGNNMRLTAGDIQSYRQKNNLPPGMSIDQADGLRNFGRNIASGIAGLKTQQSAPGADPNSVLPVAANTDKLQKLSDTMPSNCAPPATARNIQMLLKADDPNVDLGATGRKKDGIDNDFGPKTKAALEGYIKKYGGDPKLLAGVNGITLDPADFGKNNAALNTALEGARSDGSLNSPNPGAPTSVPVEPPGVKHQGHLHSHRVVHHQPMHPHA